LPVENDSKNDKYNIGLLLSFTTDKLKRQNVGLYEEIYRLKI